MNLNRRGVFHITTKLLEEELKNIYSIFVEMQFVIHAVSYDFSRQVFIYTGTSPKFHFIPEGQEAPWYELKNFKGEKND